MWDLGRDYGSLRGQFMNFMSPGGVNHGLQVQAFVWGIPPEAFT